MRTIYGYIFFLLSAVCANAQDVEFKASASPNVLHAGEQFNLIYTSNKQITDLDLPEIADFDLLGGPSQGHNQSFSSVNGKITRTSTYQYTYFLRARNTGKFTIPAATAKIGNKEYQSNSVTIEIVAGQNSVQQPAQTQSSSGQQQQADIDDKSLFVRLIPDKSEVFLGEQITVTVKLYSQVNLSGINPFKGPDFTGFYMEPVEVPALRSLEREAYNGDVYGTGVLQKLVVTPQQTGEIVIEPFDIDVFVRQEVRRRTGDSFFDDFFFDSYQNVQHTLKSKPLTIKVKPLPEGQPDSFNGAVGSFRLTSSLNKMETETNDPLTLKYMISGKGNLKLMDELTVDIPSGLEKYDPVINTNMNDAASGSKTFEYLVIPHRPGTYTIPPAEFTYFDPSSQNYQTLLSESYTVQVEKGQWDTLSPVISGVMKEDVQLLNQDIHYIKVRPLSLTEGEDYFADSLLFYLLVVILLLAFVVLVIIRNRIKAYNADVIQVRRRKADRYAQKRLKHCSELISQEKYTEFYDVLLAALWRYLSDKLNIPLSGLSRDTAEENLRKREVNEEVVKEFFRITSECEVARYTPVSEYSGLKQVYQDALKIISRIQQELK